MEFHHKPVLLEETIENLDIKPDGVYIDGTLGGAGHSSEILRRLDKNGTLIGLDQDEFALKTSQEKLTQLNLEARIILANTNFVNIKEVCEKNNIDSVDGILLDLGVSSHQLDEASRGFSYNKDAPLDMRMDRRGSLTAKTIVNEYDREEIKAIIRDYGEERWASRIADFIVAARKKKEIETTEELVDIIKAAIPGSARREGPHPAKRTFQALRIAVNNELGILDKTIEDGTELLKSGGRFCIITFHSLEDRIVKDEFNKKVNPCICPKEFPVCTCGRKPLASLVNRKPIIPDEKELQVNPRSRSAKLRVLEKI
ncbi:16S rRNA (cytosine(1402)-N(4))-methyltransferase RsmH [Acetivibrio mesophilus]|uniref:Ribosomal RNA small subunit methyltransferase H n=1 Tax=Acetivibrio mesophilus TaxID=2487273 RepID=A0A4Q0I607_9FIRM|nr:16S rRNA (cytosine(1402)-N(4))-methyltransferase RsmH [Acetivibrio mesophilus]ODM25175.1 16S rRNA (cytosine(1402)-N(4))-methyltransferase [Clostridium sp. Bc-iso-3]RXE59806.1 16S rRNA (cytosine(1402)-N(4))-methyltransferase RsmH [Acetivibrio mesophilus]HHV29587.1 16S rRNA (cytosine(1402)-N(4))-methyltransferase RsmH [Clostridium sp.]